MWKTSPPSQESTETVHSRILAARSFGGRREPNAKLAGEALRRSVQLVPEAERLLSSAAKKWSLSARAVHRTLRVARTIADLAEENSVSEDAIAEALAFRHETLKQ